MHHIQSGGHPHYSPNNNYSKLYLPCNLPSLSFEFEAKTDLVKSEDYPTKSLKLLLKNKVYI